MTTKLPQLGDPGEPLFRLSDMMNRRVLKDGDKIGTLDDLVIVDKGMVAEVTHVCVHRPFGRPRLYVPWDQIAELTPTAVILEPQVQVLPERRRRRRCSWMTLSLTKKCSTLKAAKSRSCTTSCSLSKETACTSSASI